MQRSLGFVEHQSIGASNEDGQSTTIFDSSDLDNLRITGLNLFHQAGGSQFILCEALDASCRSATESLHEKMSKEWCAVATHLANKFDFVSLDVGNYHDLHLGKEV